MVPAYACSQFYRVLSLDIFPNLSLYGDRNLSALRLPFLQCAVLYVKHYVDPVKKALCAVFFNFYVETYISATIMNV